MKPKLKLPSAPLIVPAAVLMLSNCAGPVDGPQGRDYSRDEAAARATQRGVERQERRSNRRTGRFDRGFTGNYGS